MKRFLSVVLTVAALIGVFYVHLNVEAVPDYFSAVDFSVLANRGWVRAEDGIVNTNAEIFTDGIWIDSAENLGVGNGKLNIKGMLPQDSDGDGRTDRLVICPYDENGMSFTLGFNRNRDFTGAAAIAIHIDNDENNSWSEDALLTMKLQLIDKDGNSFAMKEKSDITDTHAINYYADVKNKELYSRNIKFEGYKGWFGGRDGWYIIPLSGIEDGFDLSRLKGVNIWASSWSGCYMTIDDIGFVVDVNEFIYNEIGIWPYGQTESIVPKVMPMIDFTVLTPGSYRDTAELGWAGKILTDSEIITKGIWVDDEDIKGFNNANLSEFPADKTNMHGFIANDEDGDGKTDSLTAIPNNNSGMQFTLGVNNRIDFTGASAIAVHIDCDGYSTLWNGTEKLWLKLSLIDSNGRAYTYKSENIAEGTVSYYASVTDKKSEKTIVSNDSYGYYYGNKDGWYIIELSAFQEGMELSDIKKINFQTASWWQSNITVADVCFVRNSDEFAELIINSPEKLKAPESPTLKAAGGDTLICSAVSGMEYSIDGTEWISSGVFTGLETGNTYGLMQRVAETEDEFASEASEPLNVTLYKRGDINHSGELDATDFAEIKKHILGITEVDDIYTADANLDGEINIIDFVRMKKLFAVAEDISSKDNFNLSQTDFIRDVKLHETRYQHGGEFCIDSGLTTYGISHNYDEEIVRKSIAYYNLPDAEYEFWPTEHRNVSEWGWSFFLSTPDGLGQQTGIGGFDPIPLTRNEAIAQLKRWMITSFNLYNVLDTGFEANNGHYPWFHYAAEFGASSVTAEIGETISSAQTRLAFARGAARQYEIGWAGDFSYWYNNLNRGYTEALADNKGNSYGHSHSLHERSFLLCYMGGAGWFMNEDSIALDFWENKFTQNGCYQLTDVGKTAQKYYAFTQKNKDIGITYSPFGILMDREHGIFGGHEQITPKKAFRVWDYTAADDMNNNIMQMFFPDTNIVLSGKEANFLTNSPFGNTCDVILENASQRVLDSYPCLIMSGDLSDATVAERTRYKNYVENGGTLVMNTAYLELFPDYKAKYDNSGKTEIKDGKGKAVIYGGDYDISRLHDIIAELCKEYIPFKLSATVDYCLNIKNGSIILTLINNKGVYKDFTTEEYIDNSAVTDVTVTYTGIQEIKAVNELWNEESVTLNNKSIATTLEPGGIKVFEFVFD